MASQTFTGFTNSFRSIDGETFNLGYLNNTRVQVDSSLLPEGSPAVYLVSIQIQRGGTPSAYRLHLDFGESQTENSGGNNLSFNTLFAGSITIEYSTSSITVHFDGSTNEPYSLDMDQSEARSFVFSVPSGTNQDPASSPFSITIDDGANEDGEINEVGLRCNLLNVSDDPIRFGFRSHTLPERFRNTGDNPTLKQLTISPAGTFILSTVDGTEYFGDLSGDVEAYGEIELTVGTLSYTLEFDDTDNSAPYTFDEGADGVTFFNSIRSTYTVDSLDVDDINIRLRLAYSSDLPIAYIALSMDTPVPTIGTRVAVNKAIPISIVTPVPTLDITVSTYAASFADVSISMETPAPTIGIRGNAYDPYKDVAINMETPLPTIEIGPLSRFLPGIRELYVCDSNGSQLWHFTDPDDITTGSLVGSFPTSMGTPSAMAQDNDGVAYVLASKVIWRIPDLTNPAGAEEIGALSAADLETVTCIAFDAEDRLFFVERNFRTVYHIDIHTALHENEQLAARRVSIDRLPSSFSRVDGLSFSSQNIMYMAENGSNTIGYLTDLTDAATAIEVSPSFTNVNGPITIALDDDDILYVSDNPTDKLWKLEDLTDPSTAVEVGEYPDDLQSPTGSIIVTTSVDLEDVVYRDVAVSIENTSPTIGVSLGTYVASFNNVSLSIETPLPTIGVAPDTFDAVFNDISVSVETPIPTIGIFSDTFSLVYNDISIIIETPLPTVEINPDSYMPIHSFVAISMETPLPTIGIRVDENFSSRFTIKGNFIWRSFREYESGASAGDAISDSWRQPVRIGLPDSINPKANAPVLIAVGYGRNIYLRWDKQANLDNLLHHSIQVAESSNGPWYAPKLNGETDWKTGSVNGVTNVGGHDITHSRIPLLGTDDVPLPRILHYRVRRVIDDNTFGMWSNISSGTASSFDIQDILNDIITTSKIKDAAIIGIKIANNAVNELKLLDTAVTTRKIADAAITELKLLDTAVTTRKIADAAITELKLGPNSVSGTKIQNGAITTIKVADGVITGSKIANGTITTALISDGAITSTKIGAGSIETAHIDNDAVTFSKIANGAISSSAQLSNGVITGSKIANGTITTAKIQDGAITSTKIGAGAIETAHIDNDAVTFSKIANGAISSSAQLSNGVITGSKIANGTITTALISDGAITSTKVGAGAIETAHIDNDAVTFSKIANGAISSSAQLSNGVVIGSKISDGAITSVKLGTNSVTGSKIADGAISTAAKFANGVITGSKIANGSIETAHIDGGAVTTSKIGDGVITTSKISSGAVTSTTIGNGAITTEKMVDGVVTSVKINDGAITVGKLGAGSVTSTKIGPGEIETGHIQAGSITTDKLAAGVITADKISAGAIDLGSATVTGTLSAGHIDSDVINAISWWTGTFTRTTSGVNTTDQDIFFAGTVITTPHVLVIANIGSLNYSHILKRQTGQSVLYVVDTTRALEIRFDFGFAFARITRSEEHEELGAPDIGTLTITALYGITGPSA